MDLLFLPRLLIVGRVEISLAPAEPDHMDEFVSRDVEEQRRRCFGQIDQWLERGLGLQVVARGIRLRISTALRRG